MSESKFVKDFFAAMAAGMGSKPRPDMESVPAPRLPLQNLPVTSNSAVVVPPPHCKLDSAEKLAARVTELRRHYEPFLRDGTPPNHKTRPRLALNRFEFRLETPDDRKDAQRPYTDAGNWKTVSIPHYRGPIGPWAGYYRASFSVDEAWLAGGRVWLRFQAVDYLCEVFVNGAFVGRHEGLFAPFGFDITDRLRPNGSQVLLVRVENDAIQMGIEGFCRPYQPVPEHHQLDGDKVYGGTGQGWDSPNGWTHCPPGAGIWQPVTLESCPTTAIHDLFVRPFPEEKKAELWLETYRSDYNRVPTAAELTVYPNNFEGEPIPIGRHDLNPAGPKVSIYKLFFDMPVFRWWTPNEPHLYTLRVRLICEDKHGRTEDVRDVHFGMRSFIQDTTPPRRGTFYLNGDPLILRGTNEMGNLSVPIQQGNPEQTIEDLLIGKAAHINFWRITQRPVQREVYDLCDRLGVLFQTDLPMFAGLRHSCVEETARQAGEMERLIRSHPAAVISSLINEPFSAAGQSDRRHRRVARETLEDFFEVCINYTRLYNPDRVIKCVDGDYDPPPRHGMLDQHAYVCMHEDHGVEVGKLHKGELFDIKKGWRCGVGEYGAEALEPLATMRKRYPAEWLPDRDDDPGWTPERIPWCQAWGWHHQWYDRQDTIKDWIAATHHHQAWAVRFMHEAFRRRVDIINSTALHLLINAWPNNWLKALCSVEREPLPGYFAYADANTPLAVNLRTDRHAITGGKPLNVELWVLNDRPTVPEHPRIVYWIIQDGKTQLINTRDARINPVASNFQGRLQWPTPQVKAPTPLAVYASLLDNNGTVVHDSTLRLTVFPEADHELMARRRVAILGHKGGRAWQLAMAFGGHPVPWSKQTTGTDLVIADRADALADMGRDLAAYVEAGGTLLGLAQAAGATWQIGRHSISVRPLSGHQFVSRKTGHPVVGGLDPFYFSLWYDHAQDRIAHLIEAGLQGDDLRPITLTGTGIWYTQREEIPAGAEKRIGAGCVIVDQVLAPERMAAEPRAALYLERLLTYALHIRDSSITSHPKDA
ncbi:MAG: hypothetical protein HYV36_02855 [Lentisphaerae bacterium]|nr:hypothetical protein [Lentisphaerota bacterium]